MCQIAFAYVREARQSVLGWRRVEVSVGALIVYVVEALWAVEDCPPWQEQGQLKRENYSIREQFLLICNRYVAKKVINTSDENMKLNVYIRPI